MAYICIIDRLELLSFLSHPSTEEASWTEVSQLRVKFFFQDLGAIGSKSTAMWLLDKEIRKKSKKSIEWSK